MNRRTALYVLTGIVVLAKLNPIRGWGKSKKNKLSPVVHQDSDVLLDESGCFFMDGPFVMGTMRGRGLKTAADKLRSLRTQNRFWCNVGYTYGNKFKVNYAKRALDYILGNTALKLQIHVFQPGMTIRRGDPKIKFRQYIEQVARLTDSAAGAIKSPIRLITQRRFRRKTQAQAETQMRARSKNIQKLTFVQESQSDLLQVLDLIVGSVYGAHSAGTNPRARSKVGGSKVELERYLASKLGVSSLKASKIATKNIEISVVS